ncbi:hypothetical protein [Nocardia sp. R6R-6]|uniref:hypothetical protein n=1 Tax=Nocardia sp. R6R-6 TaxID=3459303 RepID=UPI00403D7989
MDRPEMSARPGYDRGDRGGPAGPAAPAVGGLDYQGEWSAWVDQGHAAPRPSPRPASTLELAPYEDQFTGLIDRSRGRGARRRWKMPLLGALGVAVLVGGVYLQFGTGGSAQTTGPSPSAQADVSAAAPIAQCPAERVGNRIQGNGVGGFDSGPAVIFAFQHAYYVTRSGEEVRTTTTADASVQTADAIQRGIDTIPAGTTHCVAITPGAFAGQYVVLITEHRPGQSPVTYNPQIVSTAKDGNRTLISAISRG